MATYRINHESIRQSAAKITSYCSFQDTRMMFLNVLVVVSLRSGWAGKDTDAFLGKWSEVFGSESTAAKFRKNLQNYAKALQACADVYKSAQADCYNEAKSLPQLGL